jgi:hypothetical protein
MKLRDARQTLPEETYYSRLEALLVEMARIYGQEPQAISLTPE